MQYLRIHFFQDSPICVFGFGHIPIPEICHQGFIAFLFKLNYPQFTSKNCLTMFLSLMMLIIFFTFLQYLNYGTIYPYSFFPKLPHMSFRTYSYLRDLLVRVLEFLTFLSGLSHLCFASKCVQPQESCICLLQKIATNIFLCSYSGQVSSTEISLSAYYFCFALT